MKLLSLYFSLVVMIIASCTSEQEHITTDDCDNPIIISAEEYENAPQDYIHIDTAFINDDCMTITFGASGCSGQSWELKLISDGSTLESYPVQTHLRLSLENNEMCTAYYTQTISFNIKDLQVESYSEIYLNIDSYSHQGVLYRY